MKKKQPSIFLLSMIIAMLVLYSMAITYEHIKTRIVEHSTKSIIDKLLTDHGVDPADYRFDEK